jgi:D-beta-D-heptose 7-phosphate kinase / D-beta-D-heptose 1-phosphate adenosyltransferase
MEVLVIGDWIKDEYIFGTCDRMCPESPVPVVVPVSEKTSIGGAGLVYEQLFVLIDGACGYGGTVSTKKRIFVDNHLVCRLDYDASEDKLRATQYGIEVVDILKKSKPKVLVISDYGKHTFTESSAKRIMQAAKILDIPVFVDAKHNWTWYDGAYAKFPNQRETGNVGTASYIIYKRGADGCIVAPNKKAKIAVPLDKVREVKDTTGAGDIYMAAYVAYWIQHDTDAVACATFANEIASESVEHLGTYVVNRPDYF